MKTRRITEITVEIDEIFTIRRGANAGVSCPQCGSQSVIVSATQAAALFQAGPGSISQENEARQVHLQETAPGSVLICLISLQKAAQQSQANTTQPTTLNLTPQINQEKENPS